MSTNSTQIYDVVIIGGGASGTALAYMLAHYTDVQKIALIEKYDQLGQVNSNTRMNSQSLHVGDIEMHYTREKAARVKPAALMVPQYLSEIGTERAASIMRRVQKMALAVGETEVTEMRQRYQEFKGLFPTQRMLERDEIAEVEPYLVKGRSESEPILALYDEDGHAVNYQKLAESFIWDVQQRMHREPQRVFDLMLSTKVGEIIKTKNGYRLSVGTGQHIETRSLVVNADSYSLMFAKSLGYGAKYSLVPVGASFYYSPEVLRGKVYPMQDRKLPFAGVHGDPDLTQPEVTRWGPTAKFYPVLESGMWSTSRDYFRSASLERVGALKAFLRIMLDGVRFRYFMKSMLYDMPFFGKYLFAKNVQKIVPSLRARDLKRAKGVGGMRLQRINVETGELEMGEGKILGDHAIFNMTPSPGASVCLYNGMRDAEAVVDFFGSEFRFDHERVCQDYCGIC